MGDCCWQSVECRREHRKTFEDLGFNLEEEREDGSDYLVDEQANYANDAELRALAGRGIPFYADNGPGGEYGDGRYACDGQRVVQVDCLQGGLPAVEVGNDGEPDADQLHRVHDYYEVLAAAKKAIGEASPPGRRWKSADEILKGMDPARFRDQRRLLRALVHRGRSGSSDELTAADADQLDGLESLLDDLADFAHDVLGMDCLIEDPEHQTEGGS